MSLQRDLERESVCSRHLRNLGQLLSQACKWPRLYLHVGWCIYREAPSNAMQGPIVLLQWIVIPNPCTSRACLAWTKLVSCTWVCLHSGANHLTITSPHRRLTHRLRNQKPQHLCTNRVCQTVVLSYITVKYIESSLAKWTPQSSAWTTSRAHAAVLPDPNPALLPSRTARTLYSPVELHASVELPRTAHVCRHMGLCTADAAALRLCGPQPGRVRPWRTTPSPC